MKTYEEMARDVLKRRDEELNKSQIISTEAISNPAPEKVYPASKKRRLFPKIAIPCAAAVTAAAVGITVWHNIPLSQSPGKNNDDIKLEYVFTEFIGRHSTSYSLDYEIVDIDPKDMDYSDVYKGGKTEIIYNELKEEDIYTYHLPALLDEDHVNIPDDEINEFYGIKFDRFNEVFGKGEHDPFGYYNRDIESDGVVTHAVHGYYNANTIRYVDDDDGLGDEFAVTVSASYDKRPIADTESAEKSVINGFEAVVYHCGVQLITEIDMNGVYVTISAAPTDGVYRDPDAFTFFKKIYESYLTSYTAPISAENSKQTNITTHPSKPFEFDQNDQFNEYANDFDGCDFNEYTMRELEEQVYSIDFDCLTSLHSDWKESYGKLGVYTTHVFDDNTQSSERAYAWTRNAIYYTLPDTSTVTVEAEWGELPDISAEYSTINGYKAMVYLDGADNKTYPNGNALQVAVIEMNGTLVRISTAGLTEELFVNILNDYTSSLAPEYNFIGSESASAEQIVTDKPTDNITE